MNDTMTRRAVLLRAMQLPLAGAAFLGLNGCGSDGTSSKSAAAGCADPNTMTTAEQSMRKSLGYVEAAPNPQQSCAGCAFFHATTGACGTCNMFNGSSVSAAGHCNSWSAKS